MTGATYNALGKLYDLMLGNGLTTSYRYWGLDYGGNANYGLLRSIATGSPQSLTYDSYDLVGNVKKIIDGRNGNEATEFSYDELDRLTRAWTTPSSYDETYSYNILGNFGSKGGVGYAYPSPGSSRPHAPLTVGGNSYGYDANGNLTNAEGRDYDLENRLWRVREGGSTLRTLEYDGDGVLRASTNQPNQKTLYVTPDYQVNLATGEISVYYRFGGRGVAWRNNAGVRYLLADHLSSTHGEAGENQADLTQRRYMPFGSDRAVGGASDLSTDERFTSQRRSESGGGNYRRELYYYRARWYLPGVGIFTQPDTIVPDYKNPQGLNRFAYGYNNPLRYSDPTGHQGVSPSATPTPTPNPALTVAPRPAPTPGQSGTPIPPGPILAQATPMAAPTPAWLPLAPTTLPANASGAQGSNNRPQTSNFSEIMMGVLEYTDPLTPKLARIADQLASGQTVRQGPMGERIHENVGGATGWYMTNVLKSPAFTFGADVFSTDQIIAQPVLQHEEGHVQQWLSLGPLYVPGYLANSVDATVKNTMFGGGFHFWNLMEQDAEQRGNNRLFPRGTP